MIVRPLALVVAVAALSAGEAANIPGTHRTLSRKRKEIQK